MNAMAQATFGWLWQNARFSDMELLIATPDSLSRPTSRKPYMGSTQEKHANAQPTLIPAAASAAATASLDATDGLIGHRRAREDSEECQQQQAKWRKHEATADKQGDVQASPQTDTKPGGDQASAAAGDIEDQAEVDASKGAGGLDKEQGTAKQGGDQHAPSCCSAPGSKLQQKEAVADDSGQGALPDGIRMQACRMVLGSCSEYFRTRVTSWDDDPHTLRGKDGRPVLVVAVEPELTEAAQAVVRLMYDGVVAKGMGPQQLAQMCRVADMWGVPGCLQHCFAALSQLDGRRLDVDSLADICSWLPNSVAVLPSYSRWKAQLELCVVKVFSNVYTLLTTYDQLQRFRQLPFHAVLAWADSDKLLVDSENSVAVALSWWYGGDLGSQATEDQLEELSGVLRVGKLSSAYRLTQLRTLPWFKCKQEDLDWFCVAASKDRFEGYHGCPAGWSKKSRLQCNAADMVERTTIVWDIPADELEAALSHNSSTTLYSDPVYAAGSGLQLMVQVGASGDGQPRKLGVYLQSCTFDCEDATVVPTNGNVHLKFSLRHLWPDTARPHPVIDSTATLHVHAGCGYPGYLKASSMADVQHALNDGDLKLSATFTVIH